MRPISNVSLVTRACDGTLRTRCHFTITQLKQLHTQIGTEDCSAKLALRGLPVFLDLVGPIPDGNDTVRYESPEVFEFLTMEWSQADND